MKYTNMITKFKLFENPNAIAVKVDGELQKYKNT